jgi:hypothetical protein
MLTCDGEPRHSGTSTKYTADMPGGRPARRAVSTSISVAAVSSTEPDSMLILPPSPLALGWYSCTAASSCSGPGSAGTISRTLLRSALARRR